MKLTEGLKEGDLEYLVDSTISIDEYESKLDDDSIVVGFFIDDKDPAEDLNRFIQKGATAILDTDVSPAPNEDGKFMVFVEMLRDKEFPAKLCEILENIRGLTGHESWLMTVYNHEEPIEVSAEAIKKNVRLISMEDNMKEEVMEFFRPSALDDLIIEGKNLTFKKHNITETFELVDLDVFESLAVNNAVLGLPVKLDESTRATRRVFEALLGDHWLVEHLGSYVVLSRFDEPKMALVRI